MNAVSNTTVERVYYLDYLRIIAIAFVILLHGITPYIGSDGFFGTKTWWLCLFINAVVCTGVPLFFMMSGYLLLSDPKSLNISLFYKKRYARILIPFLIWDIVYFVCYAIIQGEKSVLDFFRELLVEGSSYHFWYVYTLAGIYLLIPFLKRIVNNCSQKELIWFLVIITFTGTLRPFINTALPIYVYLFKPLMEGYIGFLILGYILGTQEISRLVRHLIYLAGAGGLLLSAIGNHIYSSSGEIDLFFNVGYQINHFLIAASIFVFFKHLKFRDAKKLHPIAVNISRTVYGVYLMHVLVLELLQRYVSLSRPVYDILFNSVMTFIICICVMLTASKIKYLNRLLM